MQDALALSGVIGFSLGVLAASTIEISLPFALFVLLLAAGFFFAWFFGRRDWYLFPALLLLVFALGSMRVAFVPQELGPAFAPLVGVRSSLEGTVITDPDVRETNQRITLRVLKGKETADLLIVAERFPEVSVGDVVVVEGTPERPAPFATDGGRMFAYDAYLKKDGIFLLVPHARVTKVGESRALPLLIEKQLYRAKHVFMHGLEAALPEPHASLAEGLLVGGKQGLGATLIEAFTIAGLLPLIVLSGYNVMIVAETVLLVFSFLPKRTALILAGVTIILFVLAAGSGSSAVRAGIMASLALFARMSGRTYDALRALLAVFVLMLLVNPLLLAHDPGFQFSFAATLGLILLSSPFERMLVRVPRATLRSVAASTLAAQIFVLPLLLYQTGFFSVVSVPANIFVLPLIPFAMLFSFVAGLVGMSIPVIAPVVALPAYVLLAYVIGVAEVGAHLPFAHVLIPEFPSSVLLLAYAPLFWLVYRLQTKQPSRKNS